MNKSGEGLTKTLMNNSAIVAGITVIPYRGVLIGSVRLSPPSFRAEFTIKTTQASPCPWNPIILSKEAQLTPSCIVMRPADTQHVALVIKTLSAINNLCSNQCQIAIRGGGHRPYAGSANIGNGIAVDLGLMNAVSVRSDRSITSVGPGSRWIDVYAKLDPMNLAMVGGRDNPVGVAGLSLGAYLSFLLAKTSFVCGNIKNYKVVLANGSMIDVNQN
ncbi:hypothetical protein MMC20_008062 [Loxospora ochrophaea]|nr:hypothetical protein [Loxospora ochrophaea]